MSDGTTGAEEITAELLPVYRPSISPFRFIGSFIAAVLPLMVLGGLFVTNTDLFLPDEIKTEEVAYFPSVSIVFVETKSERRRLQLEGVVEPQYAASIRAKHRSEVIAVGFDVGDFVTEGQPVCRLKMTDGNGVDVLLATMSGQVSAVNALSGTIIEAGKPCMTIVDTSSSKVASSLAPRHAEIIRPGDDAAVTIAGREHQGEIEVIYPPVPKEHTARRPLEVMLPKVPFLKTGETASLTLTTDQVMPTLIPQHALAMCKTKGLCVRSVHGMGPTGVIETVPIRIIAATEGGFYVEGLPLTARIVINDRKQALPRDGETVRIGRVA
ncbi:MAG: HlyD family efflux transporter periplasmic adaptor subunit [Parvularcula sp.]|jgi:hypothetical protein|nr:HlyD family efflux transporter periplasmic adaptor subunit [Parvularcula sp.]